MASRSLTNYKVKLISVASLRFSNPDEIESVVFENTPTLSETRSVDYNAVTPIHMPGSIQIYKSSNSRNFSIGATLISRSDEDVIRNIKDLQMLRGWTMPYFGSRTANTEAAQREAEEEKRKLRKRIYEEEAGKPVEQRVNNETAIAAKIAAGTKNMTNLVGAPPDVLYLYAYSAYSDVGFRGGYENINRVPVVLTNLDISYPDDVDYLSVAGVDPFPTKMTVSISLVETHSPGEYERFSLQDFKNGTLTNF